MRVFLRTGVCLVVGACGLTTVNRDYLRQLTIEQKLLLFDAENDVNIALDERENLRGQIRELKDAIAFADQQQAEADSDAERWSEKGRTEQAALARQAVEVFELKLEYLDAELDFLRTKLDVQDALIKLAWAKFELAKAKLVKSNNTQGAADIDLEDFEEQVTSVAERASDEKEDLKALRQETDAVRTQWESQRDRLAKASGGGVGSPWTEQSAGWGR